RAARAWALAGAVAAALGPALGGILVQASWHWAFLINVPVGIALVVVAVRVLPDPRHDDQVARPDLVGAAGIAVSAGALVLALVQGEEWGWLSASTLAAVVVAAATAVLVVVRCRTHPVPVIDPALFRVPAFTAATTTTVLFNTAFGGALLGAILWLQAVWGYGALQTGLAIALGPLTVPVTSIVVHRLLPGARPMALIVAGCAVFAAGTALLVATLGPEPAYVTGLLPGWLLAGVGVGLAMPNLVAAATADLPAARTSTGSAVVAMARQIGLALGVSLLVAVLGATGPTPETLDRAFLALAGAAVLAGLTGATLALTARRAQAAVAA
ncbi:MFS transporter, partial [Nocardioides sp. YIM 152588]|uniref:MFS transporter n=1 Tax=Nocardioides sp. YIM 152588 TaxID=3158259 RepID=UPI0032E4FA55